MAELSPKKRKSLPASAFAYPAERKYPIQDRAHARNALARAAQSGTSGTYEHVRRKVKARFPDIETKGKGKKR
jgi:hypothetical protein